MLTKSLHTKRLQLLNHYIVTKLLQLSFDKIKFNMKQKLPGCYQLRLHVHRKTTTRNLLLKPYKNILSQISFTVVLSSSKYNLLIIHQHKMLWIVYSLCTSDVYPLKHLYFSLLRTILANEILKNDFDSFSSSKVKYDYYEIKSNASHLHLP